MLTSPLLPGDTFCSIEVDVHKTPVAKNIDSYYQLCFTPEIISRIIPTLQSMLKKGVSNNYDVDLSILHSPVFFEGRSRLHDVVPCAATQSRCSATAIFETHAGLVITQFRFYIRY